MAKIITSALSDLFFNYNPGTAEEAESENFHDEAEVLSRANEFMALIENLGIEQFGLSELTTLPSPEELAADYQARL